MKNNRTLLFIFILLVQVTTFADSLFVKKDGKEILIYSDIIILSVFDDVSLDSSEHPMTVSIEYYKQSSGIVKLWNTSAPTSRGKTKYYRYVTSNTEEKLKILEKWKAEGFTAKIIDQKKDTSNVFNFAFKYDAKKEGYRVIIQPHSIIEPQTFILIKEDTTNPYGGYNLHRYKEIHFKQIERIDFVDDSVFIALKNGELIKGMIYERTIDNLKLTNRFLGFSYKSAKINELSFSTKRLSSIIFENKQKIIQPVKYETINDSLNTTDSDSWFNEMPNELKFSLILFISLIIITQVVLFIKKKRK